MNKKYQKLIIILLTGALLATILSAPLLALAQQQKLDPATPAEEQGGIFSNIKNFFVGKIVRLATGPLLFTAGIIGKLLGFIFSWIIYFEAWILDTTLSGFNITNAKIVQIGWGIARDLANMAFVLALIIIAISTILRIKAFASQQMLWRVIVAALLVNFSLVFAGIVVDASQLLAKFFINAATGNNPAEFSLRLANAMDITAFYNPGAESVGNAVFKAANSIWVAPAGIILGLVALVIMTFVFGAAAFFMLVRVIWLWILLIFSPFAWAALAFPGQSGEFNKWWNSLFHWAFFAPIFTFFMYLSLTLFQENGRLSSGIFSAVWPTGGNQPIAYIEASAPEAIMQFGLMIGLMIAGLIAAQKFGAYGAKAIEGATIGAAKSTALWATKTGGNLATVAVARAARAGSASASRTVRTVTAPIRAVGVGLGALGGKVSKYTPAGAKQALAATPANPLAAIFQGAKSGSGLFKKKQTVGLYECQNCNHREQSVGKPTFACPACGAPATLPPGAPAGTHIADWQQI